MVGVRKIPVIGEVHLHEQIFSGIKVPVHYKSVILLNHDSFSINFYLKYIKCS